jgi:hypothetical protein
MKKGLLLLCILFVTIFQASAQLWVDTTNYSAEQMVSDFFNTDVTSVSNITYTGSPCSMCFFEGSQSNLGMNAGLLITTGSYIYAPGPNDNESATGVMDVGGDADLSALIDNYPTFDAAVVEFDLVATTDLISLEYVFGSEEYLEFVGSSFNDIFAFFISGGTEYPALTNIALIPGSSTPVSINSLNQNLYSEYFIDNTGGATLQYDGFTTPLQAIANVTPGETYHIKIGVSDASDSAFDSGVFLSVESLGGDSLLAPQPDFEALVSTNTVNFTDHTLYATSWFWDFGDGATSEERNPVHTYSEDLSTHQYIVSLTTTNYCCSQTHTIEVGQASVGTPELNENVLKIASNPGNGLFQVTLPSSEKGVYCISDLAGRNVKSGIMTSSGILDCTDFSKGVYMLHLELEGKIYVEKLVIR